MARRRRRAGPGTRLVILAITAWFLWYLLNRIPRLSSTAAALITGLAVGILWGLVTGWRFRGTVDRAIRRLIWRLIHRWGHRIRIDKEDWW